VLGKTCKIISKREEKQIPSSDVTKGTLTAQSQICAFLLFISAKLNRDNALDFFREVSGSNIARITGNYDG
jgi:hypothetical protein